MNINRNNYEEYFLLYADNELSQRERNMVELFVQQNSDLEEELVMYRQSVVKPDDNIMLEDKSFLFRQEETFINKNNYEEIFVLYNDNELNDDEKRETEKFVTVNQDLQSEFALLQRIKMVPDTSIGFPGKRSLYKKEEKSIPIIWWRMAAAAVLIGFGLWGGINYLQKDKKEQPVAIKKNLEQPKKTIPVTAHPKQQLLKEQQQNIALTNDDKVQGNKTEKKIVKDNSDIKQAQKVITPNENTLVKNIKPIEQNKEETVIKEPQKKMDEILTPLKNIDKTNTNVLAQAGDVNPPNNFVQNASYVSDEINDNYIFYNVSEDKFKKSKVFGFLKRVKRVIQRESPFNRNTDAKEVAAK